MPTPNDHGATVVQFFTNHIFDPSPLLFSEPPPSHIRPHLAEATNQRAKSVGRKLRGALRQGQFEWTFGWWQVRFRPPLRDEEVSIRHRHVEYLSDAAIRHVNAVKEIRELPCETHPHRP